MQVFYVNIGGGEPTVRPDFWDLLDYATAHHVGVKFSTNGVRITPRRPRRLAAQRLRRRADLARRRDRRGQRRGPRPRLVRHRDPGDGEPRRRPGFDGLQDLRRVHPAQHRPAGRVQGASPTATARQLRLTRLRPSGRGADVWDELHPTAGAAAPAVRLAAGARRGRADRRLVLPPGRLRRGAARPQPVRRRPGGLPDRPGRRRVRLPVRDPRRVPRRQRARRRRLRRRLAGVRAVPRAAAPQTGGACASCRHYDACRGGCMAAKFFTGLPLDGPDPECVQGYGEIAGRTLGGPGRPPRPARTTRDGR